MTLRKMSDVILAVIVFIWIPVVITASFYYAPSVKGLGETGKIIIYHVPCSWITVLAFLLSAFYSVKILTAISRNNGDIYYLDTWAEGAARIGFLFAVLATVTGSIWAKQIWHSYWNWDPRETSIFILLLIYAAYFALRSAIANSRDKIRISAVYSIFAFLTVPFFIFIVPRIYASLHPDPLINETGEILMGAKLKQVFFTSLFGFSVLAWYMVKITVKLQQLANLKEEIAELEDGDE